MSRNHNLFQLETSIFRHPFTIQPVDDSLTGFDLEGRVVLKNWPKTDFSESCVENVLEFDKLRSGWMREEIIFG